ncbi:hypothetical protein HMPREF0308_2515 [Corynebacterium striatum ATCC 6940]|nr:hypothetical protein HMPREF0308_2515 [Corynebacterium striatum ATCC 6940]
METRKGFAGWRRRQREDSENLAAHVAPALGGSRTTKDQSSSIPSTNSCRSPDLRATVSSVHFE